MNRYPFCLFRIPENGGRVLWEITNTCNYHCSYCIFSSESKKYENELTTNEVKQAIKDLKENNFTYIKFTGGEPFTRKDMTEILKYANKLGFDMDISTNASLVTDEIAKELKNIKFPMVHVSLDGSDKTTHEYVRGKDTFEKTLRGIRYLTENNVYTRIGTVIYKQNEDKLEDIIKLAIELKANEIIFSFMEAVGRLEGDETIISKRTIDSVKCELEQLAIKYKEQIQVKYSFTENRSNESEGCCPAVNKFLYINNLGQVSPCTWVVAQNPEYKSEITLKNSTLSEIIKSEPIQKYLKYIQENKIKGCPANRRKHEFTQIYSFTTENIAGYFEQIDFTNKNVLTVAASGAHIINAFYKGAKNVIGFDINELALKYTDLKLVALEKLEYEEFLKFFLINENALEYKTYQSKLKQYLPKETQVVWDKLYKEFENNGYELRNSNVFNNKYDKSELKIKSNLYLKNEEEYNRARKSIKNVQLINANFRDIKLEDLKIQGNCDIILMSNISDYLESTYKMKTGNLKRYIQDIVINFKRENNKIVCAYLYNVENSNYRSEIDNPGLRKNIFDLLKLTNEEKQFKSVIDNCIDSVIII